MRVTSPVRYIISRYVHVFPLSLPFLLPLASRSLHSRPSFICKTIVGAPLWRIVGSEASVQSTTPRLFPISSAPLQNPFSPSAIPSFPPPPSSYRRRVLFLAFQLAVTHLRSATRSEVFIFFDFLRHVSGREEARSAGRAVPLFQWRVE